MTLLWNIIMTCLFFLLGAVLGSGFLCYLDRRERGEKWTKGRSKCMVCGHELHARDLIPVVSYITLRGRCRYCGTPYSAATLLSELTMGFAGIFAYFSLTALNIPFSLDAVLGAVIYLLLGLGAVNDICCHECEYVLQWGVCVLGLILQYRRDGLMGLGICIASGIVVYFIGILVMVFKKKRENLETDMESAIGLADIVVMTGVTGMIGYRYLSFVWLFAALTAIVFMVLMYTTKLAAKLHPEETQIGIGFLPGALYAAFLAQLVTGFIII